MGIGRRAERLAGRQRRRQPRHVRLEMAAAVAGALARPPFVDDHDVAELDAGAVRAAEGPAVRDHAAAEPGSDREHHHVLDAARGACLPFPDRGRVRVVVEPGRQAEPARHPVTQREVREG